MNMQILGLQANAQHRMDDALGVWKASGKGSQRVHRSFSGWTIRKSRDGYYWEVYRPDGTLFSPYGARVCRFQSLHQAKWEADQAGAQHIPDES